MSSFKGLLDRSGILALTAIACIGVGYMSARHVVNARMQSSGDVPIYTDGVKVNVHIGALPDLPLIRLADSSPFKLQTASTGPGRYNLLVFLSAADCAGCLNQLPSWNRVVNKYHGKLAGYLVFVNSSKSEAKMASRYFNPGFEVLLSPGTASRTILNIRQTPFTVLMDDKSQVVLSEGSTNDPVAQETFVDAVDKILAPS
jgi:hypothetical protein